MSPYARDLFSWDKMKNSLKSRPFENQGTLDICVAVGLTLKIINAITGCQVSVGLPSTCISADRVLGLPEQWKYQDLYGRNGYIVKAVCIPKYGKHLDFIKTISLQIGIIA